MENLIKELKEINIEISHLNEFVLSSNQLPSKSEIVEKVMRIAKLLQRKQEIINWLLEHIHELPPEKLKELELFNFGKEKEENDKTKIRF